MTLNVYNATDRSGPGGQDRKRDPQAGLPRGDRDQRPVAAQGRRRCRGAVRAERREGGKLGLGLVKGSKAVKDSRTDSSVDLVLGMKYTALAAAPKSTPKPTATKAGGC